MRPEEHSLRSLDNLLIHALWRVVHDDRARLIVDFGVDACIPDQVDDPFLALLVAEAEAGGEVPA